MQTAFDFCVALRKNFIQMIEDLSLEQINKIPDGFNNNIAWNFGHIVVSGESLAYIASEVNPMLMVPYRQEYGKGSRPEKFIDQLDINHFKERAFTSIEKIKNDMISGRIQEVKPYVTQTFGIANNSPEAIMQCIAMHDSYHYGCARTLMQKIIK